MPIDFNISIDANRSPLDAVNLASGRDVLPSGLSSVEQREAFSEAMREVSVFSARTTNAHYLQAVNDVVAEVLNGDLDVPQARIILRRTLDVLGYTPEGGFPDDAPGDVPPAVEGTLQALNSNSRLNLVIDTQVALSRGRGQRDRGLEPGRFRAFPAWELVRVGSRRVVRLWQGRWQQAGGTLYDGRMIAIKDDPFWAELGSTEFFDDALDVSYPPFAFNSGMGWRAVSQDEARSLGVVVRDGDDEFSLDDILDGARERADDLTVPFPDVSLNGLDDGFVDRLEAARRQHDAVYGTGDLSIDAIVQRNLERSGS